MRHENARFCRVLRRNVLNFAVFEKKRLREKMVFRIDDRIFEDQMGAGQFWERNMSGVRGENVRFGRFTDDFSG